MAYFELKHYIFHTFCNKTKMTNKTYLLENHVALKVIYNGFHKTDEK